MASALILNGPLLVDEALKADFLSGLHVWERNWHAREHAGHMAELFDIRDTLAHGEISAERLSDYVVQALSGRGPFWWGHHAAFTYDLSARLPQIACPTLILTNTGDQIHDHALRTKALRPDFSLISLDGGGIDIVDEQPDRWAEAVARFLAETGNDL
ncbi:alpha/beta fold hydrolase [Novosphingobium sp. 9]|uniref:alpha/beta fold hydrolase n=1 Tax=Novosphingobium sp. 9 TaxID=2025349 RepID=UPI0021B59555|nr:alpha/beta hydrolase [Novosphingobium sp. 9]